MNTSEMQIALNEVQRLCQESVIVELHIGRPRAQPVLTEDDLGVPKGSIPNFIELGRMHLWPIEVYKRMHSLENGARAKLYKVAESAFGRLIPFSMYDDFNEDMQERRKEYLRYVLSFAEPEQHELMVDEVMEVYREYAENMYARARKLREIYESEDNFVSMFMEKIFGMIPTPQQIRANTYFDIEYKALPMLADPQAVDDAIVERYAANSARLQKVISMRNAIDRNANPLNEVAQAFVSLCSTIVKEAIDVIVEYEGNIPNRTRGKLARLLHEASALQEALGDLRDPRTDILIEELASAMRSPQANLLSIAMRNL